MMKRWLVSFGSAVVLLLFTSTPVLAQGVQWIPVEKGQWKTMAWDAVTQLTDGDPIPDVSDATLTYNVYVKNFNTGAVIPIASGVVGLSQELILPKRARYLGGVEASLLYAGDSIPIKSAISWSDNTAVCQGGQTFGLKFQTQSQNPKGLR